MNLRGVIGSMAMLPLLLLGCAAGSVERRTQTPPPAADAVSFNVTSFNVRYDTPNDGDDAWSNRKETVAGLLRFHKVDFAGLQEALLGQIEDLENRLTEYDWIGVGRSDGKVAGEFTPIFYRRERFEPLEHDTFWLSETPDVPGSKSWDAAIERIATWGIFRDRTTGRRFVVLNTHFDHVGAQARAESARLILNRLTSIAPDLPRIVTGDFNTTDDTEPYRVLTGSASGLRDAFVVTREPHYGPTSTWNGFSGIVPDLRIDFVFVGKDVDVLRHGILTERMDGRFPSDHLPVLAEVVIR